MHFTKIFDVIDTNTTLYVEGTDTVLKLRLDYNKVKHLHVFNSQPAINDVLVSDKVRASIKQNKLDSGIEFMPIYCGEHIIMNEKIAYWIQQINAETASLPHIIAFNFELFETGDGYRIYLIGSKPCNEHDDDWAFNADFEPQHKYLMFSSADIQYMNWEEFQNEVGCIISDYLSTNRKKTAHISRPNRNNGF